MSRSDPRNVRLGGHAWLALVGLALVAPSCWSLSEPLPASPCADGLKLCGDRCVSLDDPAFGCAAASCEPCGDAHGTPTCDQGLCALSACDADYGDCNDEPSDGCETLLVDNAEHCGMCGYDCRGTACTAGMCDPIQIASGQLHTWNVVATATHVYWTNDRLVEPGAYEGGIWFTTRDATEPSQAQLYALGQAPQARDLVIDDGYVYWAATDWSNLDHNEVRRARLDLPAPLGLADSEVLNDDSSRPRRASGIAVDAERVYWTDRGDMDADPDVHHYIWSVDKGLTETPRLLVDVQQRRPNILAVDDTHLYWTSDDSGDLYRAPKDPPAQDPPATDVLHCDLPSEIDIGWGLAVDDTHVYWRDGLDLHRASKADGCPDLRSLAAGKYCDTPRFLTRDGYCLFWACNKHDDPWANSQILVTSTDGRELVPGAAVPSEFVVANVPGGEHGIGVDDEWIYWTDYDNSGDPENPDGGVYKVARPPLSCE